MKTIAVLVIFGSCLLADGFLTKSLSSRYNSKPAVCMSRNQVDLKNDILGKVKKYSAPFLVGLGLLTTGFDADAAQSGGRSGGSSFRSSPRGSSTRLYSSPQYSSPGYSTPYVAPMIIPGPMISPFGYGFGFSPFSFIPINMNVLILGGLAYAVYTVLKNRAGGSDFSDSGSEGSLGSGASVMKVQVALDADWNSGNIMQTLANIAEKNGQLTSRSDISRLLSEASMALLRRQSDWNAVAYEGEQFNTFNSQQAEGAYQRLVVKERTKFEEETEPAATIRGTVRTDIRIPTQAVVSIVVALRGRSNALAKSVRTLPELKSCLQQLAADAMTDEGDNVMAVEVLWTPSEPGSVISQTAIIEDYPELIRL